MIGLEPPGYLMVFLLRHSLDLGRQGVFCGENCSLVCCLWAV